MGKLGKLGLQAGGNRRRAAGEGSAARRKQCTEGAEELAGGEVDGAGARGGAGARPQQAATRPGAEPVATSSGQGWPTRRPMAWGVEERRRRRGRRSSAEKLAGLVREAPGAAWRQGARVGGGHRRGEQQGTRRPRRDEVVAGRQQGREGGARGEGATGRESKGRRRPWEEKGAPGEGRRRGSRM